MDINKNLGDLMKEAKKMQDKMQEAQEQLSKLEVTGEAGGGMVKTKMNGRHEVLDLYTHPSLNDEPEMMRDLIIASFNDAVRKVEKVSKDKITELTSGLNLPNMLQKEG